MLRSLAHRALRAYRKTWASSIEFAQNENAGKLIWSENARAGASSVANRL